MTEKVSSSPPGERASDREAVVVLEGLHPLKHALRFGAHVERAVAPDPARVLALAHELAPDVAERIEALLEPADIATDFDVVAWARRPAPRAPRSGAPLVLLDH